MFHFIICDSDGAFCRKEKQFITAYYKRMSIRTEIDIFSSGEEVIALGKKVSAYDAVFLDADMETVGGMELGGWVSAASPKTAIVFVSDHMHYALEGYKVGAFRYIMKDEDRFEHSMEECLKSLLRLSREANTNYITIPEEKIRISVDKILFVESKAHRIIYHLIKNSDTKTEYTVYGKLDDIENGLAEFDFCRIHQSYLVNMNYASDVKRYRVILLNGMEIQISKKNYKTAEDHFVRIKGTF